MASPKYLSDEELREELLEHGITAPVTAGTRSILVKKLSQAKQNKRKVVKNSRSVKNGVGATSGTKYTRGGSSGVSSRLNTFSSDDDDSQSEEPVRRQSRGTLNTSLSNRTKLSKNSIGKTNSVNHLPIAKQKTITSYVTVSPRSGINSRVNISNYQDEYETGSDSDGAENDDYDIVDSGDISHNDTNNDSHNYTNNYDDSEETSYLNSNTSRSSNNHSRISPRYRPSSRTSPNSLRYRNSDRKRKHTPNDSEDLEQSSQSGNGNIPSDSRLRLPESADVIVTQVSVDQGQDTEVRLANGQSHQSSELSDDSQHEENIWLHSVPKVLLYLLFVFFAIVAIFYINMHKPLLPFILSLPSLAREGLVYVASLPLPFLSAASSWRFPQLTDHSSQPTTSSENIFPVCEDEEIKVNCLSRDELVSASGLLGKLQDVLLPALEAHAVQYSCGHHEHIYMNIPQLVLLMQPHAKKSSSNLDVGIRGLGKLFDLNTHWGVVSKREGEVLLGLAAANFPSQYICHLRNKIAALFYWVLAVVISAFLMWLSYVTYRHYKLKADAEKQQVMELVDQILNVLGGLGGGPGGPGKDYVALNHVRDSLIAPRDRKTKHTIWEKAVKFISHNESRVRRDIESVGGEDCDVWRWVSAIPSSPSAHSPGSAAPRPLAKTWQGQAFESLETTHNLPHISPTSSLKIRNMFDCEVEFGDTWPMRIQDSILEKCEGVSIVHVAVDRGSREGCVYLKCASPAEAGRAFRALHGWWFDGNLVTVKFLRDERYHTRFPTARIATRPLKPSNNKRLSLQTPVSSRLYPSLAHLEDQT